MDNSSQFPCISDAINSLYGLNANMSYNPTSGDEAFCTTIVDFQNSVGMIFLHICMVFLIIMILISLFGNITEIYKWFVLYAACCNVLLILTLYLFTYNVFTKEFKQTFVSQYIFALDIINLARLSSIPLVFNRFFFLYFPNYYSKIFKPLGIFSFTIGYGAMICIILPFLKATNILYFRIFATILIIICVILSILVYLRVRIFIYFLFI